MLNKSVLLTLSDAYRATTSQSIVDDIFMRVRFPSRNERASIPFIKPTDHFATLSVQDAFDCPRMDTLGLGFWQVRVTGVNIG
jgi:hypothetical protein